LESEPWWLPSFTGTMCSAAALKNMTSQLIGRFTHAVAEATRAHHDTTALTRFAGDLIIPEETRREIAVLKGLAAAYVMSSASQRPVYEVQEQIIRDLYAVLWNTGTTHLSPLFAELWAAAADDDARRRVVVDQIASYTDVTARRMHDALYVHSATHMTAADLPLPGLGSDL
ncbi:MAG: deoxyguanosinetriphosphate triphosphohydrolase, partial [Brachybacterium sp.]|nr:deoxyguanosinetriphosphate triphosphohydrolase [Brachybacterium sp.]